MNSVTTSFSPPALTLRIRWAPRKRDVSVKRPPLPKTSVLRLIIGRMIPWSCTSVRTYEIKRKFPYPRTVQRDLPLRKNLFSFTSLRLMWTSRRDREWTDVTAPEDVLHTERVQVARRPTRVVHSKGTDVVSSVCLTISPLCLDRAMDSGFS